MNMQRYCGAASLPLSLGSFNHPASANPITAVTIVVQYLLNDGIGLIKNSLQFTWDVPNRRENGSVFTAHGVRCCQIHYRAADSALPQLTPAG